MSHMNMDNGYRKPRGPGIDDQARKPVMDDRARMPVMKDEAWEPGMGDNPWGPGIDTKSLRQGLEDMTQIPGMGQKPLRPGMGDYRYANVKVKQEIDPLGAEIRKIEREIAALSAEEKAYQAYYADTDVESTKYRDLDIKPMRPDICKDDKQCPSTGRQRLRTSTPKKNHEHESRLESGTITPIEQVPSPVKGNVTVAKKTATGTKMKPATYDGSVSWLDYKAEYGFGRVSTYKHKYNISLEREFYVKLET